MAETPHPTDDESPGTVLVLGPQRPRPNLSEALVAAGAVGPMAVVTAGWRHDERNLDALRRDLPFDALHLPLYRWFDEVMDANPELKDAYRRRQERILAFKELYRLRLSAAFSGLLRLHRAAVEDPGLHEAELQDAVRLLRELDARVLTTLDEIKADFGPLDWRHEAVARHHDGLRRRLTACRSLAIAGGHVAVLLNRIRFFGLDALLPDWLAGGGTLAAWSAGAMVLSDRVVLFYDDPPEGPSEPEVLDRGLGIIQGRLVFPHARRRLRLDDPDRLRLLQARFGRCIGLENGAWVEIRGEAFDDRSADGACLVLAPLETP